MFFWGIKAYLGRIRRRPPNMGGERSRSTEFIERVFNNPKRFSTDFGELSTGFERIKCQITFVMQDEALL